MKKQGNQLVLGFIVLVIIVGLGGLLLARKALRTNYQNTTNSYQVTSDTSDQTLDKDLNAVDSSLNSAKSANTSVAQGISDTPIPQP